MIERVAQAIASNLGYVWGSSAVHHDEFKQAARAAIEAMREPTAAMCKAGLLAGVMSDDKWRAMIDEALRADDEQ